MKILGTLLIVMALVIGIVPQFTDCQSQGKALTLENGRTIPMKCHWTGEAELAAAGPMLVLGGLIAFNRRKVALRSLALIGLVVGIFAVLLPTALIGVCANPDMLCNSVMKPTLIFSGTVASAASVAVFLLARKETVQMPVVVETD